MHATRRERRYCAGMNEKSAEVARLEQDVYRLGMLAHAERQSDDLRAIRVAAQIIAVLLLLLILVGFIAIAGR